MTLSDARKKFLKHCESALSLSSHTFRAYSSDLDDAQRYFGVRKRISAVEKDQIRQYIRHLREERNLKETTIKRRLACLKLLFKWTMHEEIIKANPFDSLNERIRLPKRLPRALDRMDRCKLHKAIMAGHGTDSFERARDKAAICLMLDTGIRIGELTAIDLSDLSLGGNCLVINGKGNRQRLVYLLQKPLRRMIGQYLTRRRSVATTTDKLFIQSNGKAIQAPYMRIVLREIAKTANLSRHVTPHMLRHTCATHWLETGLDIRYVQKLLGHHSISTTEIYTHVSDQGLREALIRAGKEEKR